MDDILGILLHVLLSGLLSYLFLKIYQKIHNYNVSDKKAARATAISFLLNFFLSIFGIIICALYLIILALITPKNTGSPTLSAPDELRKWKQLLDDGVITPAEYEQKKRDVLNDRY